MWPNAPNSLLPYLTYVTLRRWSDGDIHCLQWTSISLCISIFFYRWTHIKVNPAEMLSAYAMIAVVSKDNIGDTYVTNEMHKQRQLIPHWTENSYSISQQAKHSLNLTFSVNFQVTERALDDWWYGWFAYLQSMQFTRIQHSRFMQNTPKHGKMICLSAINSHRQT